MNWISWGSRTEERFKMRNYFLSLAAIVTGMLLLIGVVPVQTVWAEQEAATSEFDRRDFSGLWFNYSYRSGGPGGVRLFGPDDSHPPLMPAGMAKMSGRVSAEEADVPTNSNDPIFQCDPLGFPRILDRHETVEFIHTDNRLLQFTQWERRLREIWLDGRESPSGDNLINLGPAWYGHSVGEWEGDTLVINTVGINDEAWLDRTGLPISFEARVEERWTRIDAETLELRMTLHDPTYYTASWGGNYPILYKPENPDYTSYYGWNGLYSGITEQICAPLDEVETFNRRIRDPASTGITN
jgi:hypothetical protein